MAGSYEHILNGWSLIENMGDAGEAVEELMWLVQTEIGEKRAHHLLNEKYYPMCRGEAKPDKALKKVMKLMRK